MKVCPACNQSYKDDISFCLADGNTLLRKGAKRQSFFDRIFGRNKFGEKADSNAPNPHAVNHSDVDLPEVHQSQHTSSTKNKDQPQNQESERAKRQTLQEELKLQEYLAIRPKVINLKHLLLEKVSGNALGHFKSVDIDSMDGLAFEHFVACLLESRGYKAEVTKGSGDLGVDIVASNHTGKVAVQVKRYNQPVSRRAISDAVAGKEHYNCDFAMVVTNNFFTQDAAKLATSTSCLLVDRDELNRWLSQASDGTTAFEANLEAEIEKLQNASYLWGEDVIALASRELIEDFGLSLDESKLIEPATIEFVSSKHGGSENKLDVILPHPAFLTPPDMPADSDESNLRKIASEIGFAMSKLDFDGRVRHIEVGSIISSFEYQCDVNSLPSLIEVSKLLQQSTGIDKLRVLKGKDDSEISIQIRNASQNKVVLREAIETDRFRKLNSEGVALGQTTDGRCYLTLLPNISNLFVAGATSRRKTAGIDAILCSLLFNVVPDDLGIILVDSARKEFEFYEGLPHLVVPIVTDSGKSNSTIGQVHAEFKTRIRTIQGLGVKTISEFRNEVARRNSAGAIYSQKLPIDLLLIINELSDFLESPRTLSQLRDLLEYSVATGIYVIAGAQVITAEIGKFVNGIVALNKLVASVPAPFDSRWIIDPSQADSFLATDEMLLVTERGRDLSWLVELDVTERDILALVEHIRSLRIPCSFTFDGARLGDWEDLPGRRDPLFLDALRTVVSSKRASTSLLQRHLRIGYGRAAAILDAMVREGYIGEMDGSTRARPILSKAYEDLQDYEEMGSV